MEDQKPPLASLSQQYCHGFLRIIVYKNGCTRDGKVISVTNKTLEELLLEIGKVFKTLGFKRLFTAQGGEISSVKLLRDDETIYASNGEAFIIPGSVSGGEWVKLNVGGQVFFTSKTTLLNREPESMLAKMFNPGSGFQPGATDSQGSFLIDRDPTYFGPILNYLRTGSLILDPNVNPKGVLEEAQFFGIQRCIPFLEELLRPKDEAPLTRRDVVTALIGTPNKSILRFQGVNLSGADLSYLDLRNINFKFAKLRNARLSHANLSFCNFERADLTGVEMISATLSGVRMANATMERANCTNCNFQDPAGHHANMEGVNLRNAFLEDSDLTGANLRVANLKNANLRSTILRGAILAGADLESSDLTGSDLHEANLRGANLKDAALELMINPLHMSQAIR